MLRASVLNYGSDWEKCLPYAEFSYNNSYQTSIKMSPFEALYGRPCKTPLMWSQPGERSFFDSAKIQDAEEGVAQVKKNLRIAQSRYKSYADRRRRELEYNVGDFVYLKVSPLRGTVRFHVKGKLALDLLGHTRSAKGLENSLTNSSYLRNWWVYIPYSMSHSYASV